MRIELKSKPRHLAVVARGALFETLMGDQPPLILIRDSMRAKIAELKMGLAYCKEELTIYPYLPLPATSSTGK